MHYLKKYIAFKFSVIITEIFGDPLNVVPGQGKSLVLFTLVLALNPRQLRSWDGPSELSCLARRLGLFIHYTVDQSLGRSAPGEIMYLG